MQWKPLQTEFDYSLVNGAAQILYLGQAEMWHADTDPLWTVKKFAWITADDGTTQLSKVETLGEVAWADRSTLPWS